MNLVSREEWHAKPPKEVTPMKNPVPYVIIHHSETPKECNTEAECIRAMQSMQNYHQVSILITFHVLKTTERKRS